jgi:hypothetical protein
VNRPELDVHLRGFEDLGDGTVVVHELVGIGDPGPAELSSDEQAQLEAITQGAVTGPGYIRKTGNERVASNLVYEFDDSVPAGIIADAATAENRIEQYTGTAITTGGPPGCDDDAVVISSDWDACLNSLGIGDVAVFVHPVSQCGAVGTGLFILGCASTRYYTSGPEEGTTVGGLVTFAPVVPGGALQSEVVLHELAHIVGLGHYDSAYRGITQVMASTATVAKSDYELGDVNGLISLSTSWSSRGPVGAMTTATGTAGAIDVSGWAFDSDAADVPIPVSFTVDGSPAGSANTTPTAPFVSAGAPSPALLGFSTTVPAPAGGVELCATATNVGPQGADAPLGCQTVTVAASTGSISGSVTEDGGTPLPTARVNLYPAVGSGRLATVPVAGDGSYSFPAVAPGDYRIRAYEPAGLHIAEYHADATTAGQATPITVSAAGDTPVDFDLADGARLTGRVRARFTAGPDPIEGLSVYLYNATGGFVAQDRTSVGGWYDFRGLPPGDYKVRFRGEGTYFDEWYEDVYYGLGAQVLTVGPEELLVLDTSDADADGRNDVAYLTPVSTPELSGTVTDASSGLAVPDAEVAVYTDAGRLHTVTAGTDGTWSIGGITPGTRYHLRFSSPGFASSWHLGSATFAGSTPLVVHGTPRPPIATTLTPTP